MAILEVGINLGLKKLVEIKYYTKSDNVINSNVRAKFLAGMESYISTVYADKLNVISFSDFQIVCYYKVLELHSEDFEDKQPLLVFAIIEKGTDPSLVKKLLKKIGTVFLKEYRLKNIFLKELNFKNFELEINNILGDLRFKVEDRISSLFG
jgi:hypothetical protein